MVGDFLKDKNKPREMSVISLKIKDTKHEDIINKLSEWSIKG